MTKRNKRNRRRRLAIAAAAAALIAGTVVGSGGQVAQRLGNGESLADLLSGRSPGERGAAGLIKNKRLRLVRMTPQQRVLPLVRTRFAIPPLDGFASAATPLTTESLPLDSLGSGIGTPVAGNDFIFVPPIGGTDGGAFLPPGNPGLFTPITPMPTPTPTPVPTTTPAGPVPEPATWLMMIFGFGTIGVALRRLRKRGPTIARLGLATGEL